MRKIGYNRRDSTSHRKYSMAASMRRYRKTAKFNYVGNGSGHRAGEKWGDEKQINPKSITRKYSKNSPSFDEGVFLSKKKRLAEKM